MTTKDPQNTSDNTPHVLSQTKDPSNSYKELREGDIVITKKNKSKKETRSFDDYKGPKILPE